MYEIEEETIDRAEWTIQELIDQKHPTAVIAFLNNKARHRGWGRQNLELQGRIDHDHRHAHLHATVSNLDVSKYSVDQLRAIEDFMGALGAPAAGVPGQEPEPGACLVPADRGRKG
jgi:hypothetical protein